MFNCKKTWGCQIGSLCLFRVVSNINPLGQMTFCRHRGSPVLLWPPINLKITCFDLMSSWVLVKDLLSYSEMLGFAHQWTDTVQHDFILHSPRICEKFKINLVRIVGLSQSKIFPP